ncbi:Uncharacterised protein [Legionella spiritensis]|nr:Uncharacterised protein [Legionella spiritensis]
MTRLPTAGAAELQFFFMEMVDVAYDAKNYFSIMTICKIFFTM